MRGGLSDPTGPLMSEMFMADEVCVGPCQPNWQPAIADQACYRRTSANIVRRVST